MQALAMAFEWIVVRNFLIMNEAELRSEPLIIPHSTLNVGPSLAIAGAKTAAMHFIDEFTELCFINWELNAITLSEEDSAEIQAWVMSIAWTEALYFAINLFFFSIAVCWLDVLFRYIHLNAFAPIDITAHEHKTIDDGKVQQQLLHDNNHHGMSALKRL